MPSHKSRDGHTVKLTPVVAIGDGYNSFTSSAFPSAVAVQVNDSAGGRIQANVSICKSTTEVENNLEIKSSAELGTPWGSFKERVDFANSLKMTSTTLTVLVFAIKSTLSTVKTVGLRSAFTAAYDLYRQAGDSYVSSLQSGGSFMAAYTYKAETTEKFENLKTTAEAIFKFDSNPFTPTFSEDIKRLSKETQMTSSFTQRGVGFSGKALPNEDHLTEFVLNFGALTLDGPEVMDFETQSYSSLPGCPPDFRAIDANRRVWVSDDPERLTSTLSDDLLDLQKTLTVIEETSALYKAYGALDLDATGSLKAASAQIRNLIKNSISPWLDDVSLDPTQTKPRPEIEESLFSVPEAHYYLDIDEIPAQMTVYCFKYFQDIDISQVPWGVTPSKIQVFQGYDSTYQNQGFGVGQLKTQYVCAVPERTTFERINGTVTKTACPPFPIAATGEYITKVRVWQYAFGPGTPWIIPVMTLKIGLTTNL